MVAAWNPWRIGATITGPLRRSGERSGAKGVVSVRHPRMEW